MSVEQTGSDITNKNTEQQHYDFLQAAAHIVSMLYQVNMRE